MVVYLAGPTDHIQKMQVTEGNGHYSLPRHLGRII